MVRFRILLSAFVFVLLVGCFEVEQEFTLNPDGSGKVVHQVTRMDILGQGESGLPEFLRSQMSEARGVDAWSDVSVDMTDDGSMQFTGTAWFSDLNTLQLDDMIGFGWEPMSGNRGRLFLKTSENDDTPTPAPPADLAAEIDKAKKEWKQSRPMMQGMLGSIAWKTTFHLPGPITGSSGVRSSGSDATFELEGERFFDTIDSLMNDDAFVEAQARAGGFSSQNDETIPVALVKKLYGDDGVYLATGPGKELFDYDARMNEALENQDAMMSDLPMGAVNTAAPVVPPAQGGDFESLEVIETHFVTNGDLSWSSEGATLKLYGTFPGSVVDATEGKLIVARTNTGVDILPDEWSRVINPSFDADEPTAVQFDVQTMSPPAGAAGFAEISGVIGYVTSEGAAEEIVLFDRIEVGTGKALDAEINRIEEGYSDDQQIEVTIGVPLNQIEEVVFRDASGTKLPVSSLSKSWGGDSVTLGFSYDGTFPANGSVVARIRRNLKTWEIPFKVTGIDFLGRPMKR